ALDTGRPRTRLTLPSYPVERERCWIEPRQSRGRDVRPLQPLLARRVRSAGASDTAFDTTVTRDGHLEWMFDHRVQGGVIAPGAAMVEMGFEAARARWGEGAHGVDDLVLHQALAIGDDRPTTWQVVIHDVADGRAAF